MSDLELTMMRRVGELNKENARLKAEVEELTGLLKASTYYNTSDEVTRLKAEVERLTKAGDAMASSIQFNEEMAKDYNGPTIVHQSVQRWNAAKEGKPQP
jgi:phage host-nuclease inhibitor protein Gam